jgi:sacsin
MGEKPDVGRAGGQQYPVLKAIQTFLQQMAEGNVATEPAVIKELLQNADDAGASELTVVLDERQPRDGLRGAAGRYAPLLAPALLVYNNAPFYICQKCRNAPGGCECLKRDDFCAIRDVAAANKRAQATAAGRFGLGFNSVYWLTDTPMLFSRREVHVFDLLHSIFDDNGWQFPLDDFRGDSASKAGIIKCVLEWCFPKKALFCDRSFAELAAAPDGDYENTIFRLPLRQTESASPAVDERRFHSPDERLALLHSMADEAARSVLFVKLDFCHFSRPMRPHRERPTGTA